jgi:drug/metabolite transporter (DMT)-like permease
MNTTTSSGPLFIFIAAILWALDGVIRVSLYTLPPSVIVFYEHLIGTALLLPFTLPLIKKAHITPRTWGALFWVALFSGVAGTLLFTAALQQTQFLPFSIVFLLQKLQPLFAVVSARLLLKETLTPRYLKWAALALIAAFFVTFPGGRVNLSSSPETVIAGLLALGAAFFWGSSTAFSRYGLLQLPHTLMTGLRFILTTPLAFIAVFLLNQQVALADPTPSQFARLLGIALSTGMVALWIYYKGLAKTPAKISTIVELAFPLTAVVIDIILYKTFLTPTQYLAASVLLYAMYQVSRLKSPPNETALGN